MPQELNRVLDEVYDANPEPASVVLVGREMIASMKRELRLREYLLVYGLPGSLYALYEEARDATST